MGLQPDGVSLRVVSAIDSSGVHFGFARNRQRTVIPGGGSMAELGIEGYDGAEPLGRGGFGTVYKARQIAFNRTVAIKVFNAEVAGAESLKTFERECRAIGQLDWCSSIVTVFNSGRTSTGEPFIVMEYAPGGSLASHLASGPMDESAARRIMGRIALALATAHDAGILHRDVKPANILISRGGEPILADFGIARLFSGGATTTGNVAGTVAFAAPEIWLDVPASPQSDIFSLGATIFATLTGHGPFSDGTQSSTATLLARAMSTAELDVDRLPISAEFRSVLATCLRRNPAARFSSARDLLDAVAPFGLGGASKPIPVLVDGGPGAPQPSASASGAFIPSSADTDQTRLADRPRGGGRRWSADYYEVPAPVADSGVGADEVWPSATEYARLIQAQNGRQKPPPLIEATLVRDPLGMPMSASGQNAIVFEFAHPGGPIALRCFTRPPVGAASRYRELGTFLAGRDVGPFVPSLWVPDAVVDRTRSWPAVVMPWVDGVPLNLALEDMLDRPEELRSLARSWHAVAQALVQAGVAHGDIQCGNVLVDSDLNLNLVDMDGVYAPGMSTPPAEVGHPNFQHPRRDRRHWGPDADAFSFVVMALSLTALAADPRLWRYHNGENLILAREDFLDGSAGIWAELAGSADPEVVRLAVRLRLLCAAPQPPSLAVVLPLLGLSGPEAASTTTPGAATPDPTRMLAEHGPTRIASDVASADDPSGSLGLTVRRAGPSTSAPSVATPQWWQDEPEANDAPRPRAAPSTPPPPPRAAAPAVPTGGRTRNAALMGALGGLGTGLVASVLQAIVGPVLPPQGHAVLFLALIGGLLAGALAAIPSALMGAWGEALRRAGTGALVGSVFALLGLGVFEVIVSAVMPLETGPAPFGFLLGGWVMAAVAVGLGAGVTRRSGRAVLSGLYGGLVGGIVGALLHSLSEPWMWPYDEGSVALEIVPLWWGTLIPVLLACTAIGGAIGAVDRLRRRHWLTIIEGRGRGLELILDRDVATIGSDPSSTLRVAAPGILPRHIDLALGERPVMRAHGAVEHNGVGITEGHEVALSSGDVLRVGPSYVRVESRVGQSA